MPGAGEPELSGRGANVLERHLEIEDTCADKGENHRSDHLTDECVRWLDVSVVCQLEIVREGHCLVNGNVAVSLEPAAKSADVYCRSGSQAHIKALALP